MTNRRDVIKAPAMSVTSVTRQLRQLGVMEGGVLLVHTSFRAVRPIEGGPAGLIEALREAVGPAGTLVMPSWGGDDDVLFDRAVTPAAPDLGVVAEVFWRLPGALRSDHSQAFAALGPRASEIVADPLPLPPHIPASPVGRVHDLDGQVLLIGVGQDASSSLHLAEVLAAVPYGIERTCTVYEGGAKVRVPYLENDHCCRRFALADDWLRQKRQQREGLVGHAYSRLANARQIVNAAVARLAEDPLLFLHSPEEGCEECDEARRSVPASRAPRSGA